jgi:glycosyltransferase involved in cell wall biosynthesis
VQDFEPMFSAVGSEYALAYNSYRLPLQHIVFGDWNAAQLKKEFGIANASVRFPVDREIYSPTHSGARDDVILFYARPSQPRRLFELGFHALREVRAYLPQFTFVLFGEDIPGQTPDGFRYLGKQTDLNELAKLYSSAQLGVAFSSTNPSLIPFEMLSCGLPVIDADLGKGGRDFEGCDALIRSEPTVEGLARTIFKLATDRQRCDTLSSQALSWAKNLPTELDFSEVVLQRLGLD